MQCVLMFAMNLLTFFSKNLRGAQCKGNSQICIYSTRCKAETRIANELFKQNIPLINNDASLGVLSL